LRLVVLRLSCIRRSWCIGGVGVLRRWLFFYLLLRWLDTLELNTELKVLSGIALALAKEFDDKRSTSTAAELRKTILEIKSVIAGSTIEVDPLEKLLTR